MSKKKLNRIKLKRHSGVGFRKAKDITILRHLQDVENKGYYLLNEVGSDIWGLLETPKSLQELCSVLLKQYDVDRKTLRNDIMQLSSQLLNEKLITSSADDFHPQGFKDNRLQEISTTKNVNIYREISKRLIPLEAMFEVTHWCNMKCPHCYLQGIHPRDEMRFEEIKMVLDELADDGVLFIIFTGGEPLIRKDFSKIITYAREKGFIMGLYTNGSLLSKNICTIISNLKFDFVRISLYGDNPDISDSFTKVKGAFHHTLKGIDYCRNEGINTIVQIVVTKHNFQLSHGQLSSPQTNQEKTSNIFPSKESYPNTPGVCSAGVRTFVILPDGDTYPCFKLRLKAGNVREQNFGFIWQNSEVLKWLRNLDKSAFEDCMKCDLKHFCQAKCMGLALMEEGNIFKAPSSACEYTRSLYEVYKEKGLL